MSPFSYHFKEKVYTLSIKTLTFDWRYYFKIHINKDHGTCNLTYNIMVSHDMWNLLWNYLELELFCPCAWFACEYSKSPHSGALFYTCYSQSIYSLFWLDGSLCQFFQLFSFCHHICLCTQLLSCYVFVFLIDK